MKDYIKSLDIDIEKTAKIIFSLILAIFIMLLGLIVIKSSLGFIPSETSKPTAIVINIDETKDLLHIDNDKSSYCINRGFENMNDYDIVYIWGILNIHSNTISVTLLDENNQGYKIDIDSHDCEIYYDAESYNTNTSYIVMKANKHIGWANIDNELRNRNLFTIEIHFTTKFLNVIFGR